jgi:ABC-type multidrug transport system ATPase subunit
MGTGPVEGVLDDADVVIKQRVVNQRVAPVPMEPGGIVVVPGEPAGGFTAWIACQGPHGIKTEMAMYLGLDPEVIRARIAAVGGGFGAKQGMTVEHLLAAKAAVMLNRPVKWAETRSENMLAMWHGRAMIFNAELGLKRDGTITGLRCTTTADAGAYAAIGAFLPFFSQMMAANVYVVPKVEYNWTAVTTNTTPVAAYRGAGRPEAIHLMERILDIAADELDIDPVEIRRKNFIQPDAFPYMPNTGLGATYDTGEYDKALVGREIDHLFPKPHPNIGETILKVSGLAHGDRFRDVSFELRRGEILGVAGLVGSGRTEVALTIFGITPASAGSIELEGRPVAITSPRQACDLGIAYVPEDRGLQGLVKPMTIAQNTSMASLRKVARGIFLDFAAETRRADASITQLGTRARGPDQIVGQLSGGNQQKVVLGKWLETQPKILIMDEPTRGIDVGAKAEIHALMGRLAQEGMAILMISSELPEVLGMSDRVLVMHGGRMVATIDRADANPESVGAAMAGASGEEAA